MAKVIERNSSFTEIKDSARTDEKGRIALGSDFSGKNFRIARSEEGEILLTPVVVIPERDMWLYKNPRALALFQQGLVEAAAGEVTAAEDFSQYADGDEDE